ncbi:MAG: hypothetical protein D6698_09955 [Gammaproteobacteria bacterium]|nr:MAG: hypothetical protein D6698_09955 [Gammaproteobacteria bacterium]
MSDVEVRIAWQVPKEYLELDTIFKVPEDIDLDISLLGGMTNIPTEVLDCLRNMAYRKDSRAIREWAVRPVWDKVESIPGTDNPGATVRNVLLRIVEKIEGDTEEPALC